MSDFQAQETKSHETLSDLIRVSITEIERTAVVPKEEVEENPFDKQLTDLYNTYLQFSKVTSGTKKSLSTLETFVLALQNRAFLLRNNLIANSDRVDPRTHFENPTVQRDKSKIRCEKAFSPGY